MSVVNQDYPNKEICVVDDNSSDDSIQKICNLMNQHGGYETKTCGIKVPPYKDNDRKGNILGTQINLITLDENKYQGFCRNLGIQYMWNRCDYLCNLDSDDEWLPTRLSKSIAKIEEFPDLIGEVTTDYTTINTATAVEIREYKPIYSYEALHQECILHSSTVMTKKALEKVGLYDIDCIPKEDYLMHLCISNFFMCIHIPESLVRVRVTPKNSTVSHTQEFHQKQFNLMAQRYQEWRGKNGLG